MKRNKFALIAILNNYYKISWIDFKGSVKQEIQQAKDVDIFYHSLYYGNWTADMLYLHINRHVTLKHTIDRYTHHTNNNHAPGFNPRLLGLIPLHHKIYYNIRYLSSIPILMYCILRSKYKLYLVIH